MNLNSEEIRKKIEEIKEKLIQHGAILNLKPEIIHEFRQDCIWYSGKIGEIKYKNYTIAIGAYEDVRATLYENGEKKAMAKDKSNDGSFYKKMKKYIKDDNMLHKIENSYRWPSTYERPVGDAGPDESYFLDFKDANWLTYEIYDNEAIKCPNTGYSSVLIDKFDVLDAFDNVELYINTVEKLISLKEQAERVALLLEKNGSVAICKRESHCYDNIIKVINLDLCNDERYAKVKVYSNFNDPVALQKHPRYPMDIFNYLKSFTFNYNSKKDIVRELALLIPVVTEEIKGNCDFVEEFKNFIDGEKDILIFSYKA